MEVTAAPRVETGPPTIGYITAVLRSECASAPPPPVGEIAVGSNYVIKTVADADPLDYQWAQQLLGGGAELIAGELFGDGPQGFAGCAGPMIRAEAVIRSRSLR